MPRLAAVEAARLRGFLPDVDHVRGGLAMALAAATEALESELRTEFAFSSRVDTFYLRDSRLRGGRFHVELRLRAGLVDESENALVVEVAPLAVQFTAENPGPDPVSLRDTSESVVDSADQYVSVDAEQGIVLVQDYRLLNTYVQVSYDAGLETVDGDDGLYKQSGARSAPTWLQELATLYALREVEQTPHVGTPARDGGSRNASTRARVRDEQLARRISTLLDEHARYFPGAERPLAG